MVGPWRVVEHRDLWVQVIKSLKMFFIGRQAACHAYLHWLGHWVQELECCVLITCCSPEHSLIIVCSSGHPAIGRVALSGKGSQVLGRNCLAFFPSIFPPNTRGPNNLPRPKTFPYLWSYLSANAEINDIIYYCLRMPSTAFSYQGRRSEPQTWAQHHGLLGGDDPQHPVCFGDTDYLQQASHGTGIPPKLAPQVLQIH